jgi:two-component system osmolarity sensor histidine kinase EnvZ
MANPAVAESLGSVRPGVHAAARALAYGLIALGLGALVLALLQLLLGRRLVEQRQQQLGADVASKVLLAEVALERFTPAALAEIGGLRLAVGSVPEPMASTTDPEGALFSPGAPDLLLRRQALDLQRRLCLRLSPCPLVRPSLQAPRGVWVRMASPSEGAPPDVAPLEAPLETVWLFAPLPPLPGWPPDPLLLGLALGSGGLGAGLLYLALEVQRPLRRLEQALAEVRFDQPGTLPLPAGGSGAVRSLTARFNGMVERLERSGRERATMLAGIAHDLRSPITRLRLRLDLAASAHGLTELDRHRSEADLNALERITRQFLLFAGAEQAEPAVLVPLHGLLAEVAALVGDVPLVLDLQPLERRVRPTALARAVGNLLENALQYGTPPLRLVVRAAEADPHGFVIEVWDRGAGIPAAAWPIALEPFQRLDVARGGQGHCGLGLAIADRIARLHGGVLRRLEGGGGFGVALTGRSLASPDPGQPLPELGD